MYILDIDVMTGKGELEEVLYQTVDEKERDTISIQSLRTNKTGTKMAIIANSREVRDKILGIGEIKIGWTRCRIRQKIQ